MSPAIEGEIAALRATIGRVAEHMRAATISRPANYQYAEHLPRIGRATAVRALDAQLELAVGHARAAAALLDDLDHPELRDVRAGVEQIRGLIDERRAIADPVKRWREPAAYGHGQAFARHRSAINALDAIATSTSAAWLETLAYHPRTVERLALQRTITRIDPDVAHVEPWIASEITTDHSTYVGQVLGPLARETGTEKASAVREAFWRYLLNRIGGTTTVSAGDLRRMSESTRAAWDGPASHPLPTWLAEAADDQVLKLEPVQMLELDLVLRGGEPKDIELLVAHSLVYRGRANFIPGADWGELMARAARRLPDGLRPEIPAGVESDADLALQWARSIRERIPRGELAESAAPPARQVADVLHNGGEPTKGAIGRTRVALEVAEGIEPTTDGGRRVHALLLEQLRRNAEAFETGWHIEHAEHGRAIALAETFAALEGAARATAPEGAGGVGRGALLW